MTYPPHHPGSYGQEPQHYFPRQPGSEHAPPPAFQYGQQPSQQGQLPGYPGGPPPRKKIGMIVAVLAAVLVVAGGTTTILLVTSDNKPPASAGQEPTGGQEPTNGGEGPTSGTDETAMVEVAQAYLDTIAEEDEAAATDLTCEGTNSGALYEATVGAGVELSLGKAEVDGEYGTVEILIGAQEPLPMPMSVQDGTWCVAA